jgi:SAM-dependent methyltransferase
VKPAPNVRFLIHPTELRRRRLRCRPIVESLSGARAQPITTCNVCGSGASAILADQDRYGLPLRTAICLNCGLIYLMDRLTGAGYQDFYRAGRYRELIAGFKGRRQTLARLRASQTRYAVSLIQALDGFVVPQPGMRLLDIGGSTGLVARRCAERYGCSVTLLDPAAREVEGSGASGFELVVSSFEDWQPRQTFDLILLCRTVEHLGDLRAALTKVRSILRPDGLFYCDIADFLETCRREGPPPATTKVDHCFWLCQETAVAIFEHLGFEIVSLHLTLPPDQLGFLLRAGESGKLSPVPADWIQRQLRGFRELASAWEHYGSSPLDARDWARRTGRRLKTRLMG